MAQWGDLVVLLTNARLNATVGWVLIALVALIGVESVLDADWVWVVFVAIVVGLAVIPPLSFGDVRVMLPWEVLVLVALPLLGRGLLGSGIAADAATYLSVAALALVVAVELDVFTAVKMTTWFAVFFVVVTTVAAVGVWAVVQWLSDVYLGTTFIYPTPPPVSPTEDQAALQALMWHFVAATVTGLGAGVIFAVYFRRYAQVQFRLPTWVRRAVR